MMKTLNDDQIDLVVEALRNSIQDTLDYAQVTDYEPGELEASFGARVALLRELGGNTAGLNGKNSHLLDGAVYECQNCAARWRLEELRLEIPHYYERVAEGEPDPAGECPKCGALCHQKDGRGE